MRVNAYSFVLKHVLLIRGNTFYSSFWTVSGKKIRGAVARSSRDRDRDWDWDWDRYRYRYRSSYRHRDMDTDRDIFGGNCVW